jgi:hypothetical protein
VVVSSVGEAVTLINTNKSSIVEVVRTINYRFPDTGYIRTSLNKDPLIAKIEKIQKACFRRTTNRKVILTAMIFDISKLQKNSLKVQGQR